MTTLSPSSGKTSISQVMLFLPYFGMEPKSCAYFTYCVKGCAAKSPLISPSTLPQILHLSNSSKDPASNLRKRKRSSSRNDGHQWTAKDANAPLSPPMESKKQKTEVPMTCIIPPSFTLPKAAYHGHIPSMPRYSEKSVLHDILVGRPASIPYTGFEG